VAPHARMGIRRHCVRGERRVGDVHGGTRHRQFRDGTSSQLCSPAAEVVWRDGSVDRPRRGGMARSSRDRRRRCGDRGGVSMRGSAGQVVLRACWRRRSRPSMRSCRRSPPDPTRSARSSALDRCSPTIARSRNTFSAWRRISRWRLPRSKATSRASSSTRTSEGVDAPGAFGVLEREAIGELLEASLHLWPFGRRVQLLVHDQVADTQLGEALQAEVVWKAT
jgi:hypothetical protein